jgi:hypothetical protein
VGFDTRSLTTAEAEYHRPHLLSETAMTAEDLVVIGRGRLIAAQPVGSSSPRTPPPRSRSGAPWRPDISMAPGKKGRPCRTGGALHSHRRSRLVQYAQAIDAADELRDPDHADDHLKSDGHS